GTDARATRSAGGRGRGAVCGALAVAGPPVRDIQLTRTQICRAADGAVVALQVAAACAGTGHRDHLVFQVLIRRADLDNAEVPACGHGDGPVLQLGHRRVSGAMIVVHFIRDAAGERSVVVEAGRRNQVGMAPLLSDIAAVTADVARAELHAAV